MKRLAFIFPILLLAVSPQFGHSQTDNNKPQDKPTRYYQLKFNVEELDAAGKVTNSRTYQMSVSTRIHGTAELRTGSKVPIATGSISHVEGESKQIQYLDVGVSIDIADVTEVAEKLAMQIKAQVSSISPVGSQAGHADDPVIRQNAWNAAVILSPGKPKVILSSDDLEDKGKLQIELTATPID